MASKFKACDKIHQKYSMAWNSVLIIVYLAIRVSGEFSVDGV